MSRADAEPPATAAAASRPRCFPARALPDVDAIVPVAPEGLSGRELLVGVADREAEGVAGVLPAMVCGEESAVLVFDNERRRAGAELFAGSQATLARIAREEEGHERVLRSMAAALPDVGHDAAVRRQARRFFLSLHTDDIGTHFSRIAWLDSGVCIILSSLTRRGRPLHTAQRLRCAVDAITRDEGRHVAFSREYAARLGVTWADDRESFMRVRGGLVDLLEPCAGAFESLGVDPASLFARLKQRGPLGERW